MGYSVAPLRLLSALVFFQSIANSVRERPFADANGRTARLMMNLALLKFGYTIANIPGDAQNRLAYYNSLEKCNVDNDKSDFFNLIAGHIKTSLHSMVRKLGK